MTLREELAAHVEARFGDRWTITDGQVVPDTTDIGLGNVGRRLKATVLYADLADSTGLVSRYGDEFAAEVYKSYLYCASKVIRACNGSITAFDGDRVMAVFLGSNKNTAAADCALKINWAVNELIQPALKAVYGNYNYIVRHKVGLDTSELLVARAGIRGSNDLVWIGNAANNAAKMAALDLGYKSYITMKVYDVMHESSREGGSPKRDMWTYLGSDELGYTIYGSSWQRSFS